MKGVGCMIKAVSGTNYYSMLIGQGLSQMSYVVFSTIAGRLAVALVPQDQVGVDAWQKNSIYSFYLTFKAFSILSKVDP